MTDLRSFDVHPATAGVRTVFVSRHGRTPGNEAHVLQDWGGYELSGTGLADAEQARGWWAARQPDLVVTSPLARTRQTAKVLFGRVDAIDVGWGEASVPTVAGRHISHAHATHPELFAADGWPHPGLVASEHAETWDVVVERVLGALRRAAAGVAAGGVVGVVSHGSPLVALLGAAGGTYLERPGNLAVLELRVDPAAGWALLDVHDPLAA